MKSPAEVLAIAKILEGIPIWGVLPGSAAHRAGLRYGDIVVRVNGTPTRSFIEFLTASDVRDGRLAFDVVRDGSPIELVVIAGSAIEERARGESSGRLRAAPAYVDALN